MSKIIIDTDIGTNADDAIAIALAIRSPEVDVKGITTVYGDLNKRGVITKKVLQVAGKSDIKLYKGIEEPLLRERDVFWAGFEGEGLEIQEDISQLYHEKHAVQFIIETIMAQPGEITLVTIGPLTNIATAIILEPKITENVKEIIMMAGVTRLGENSLELEPIEHNTNCDPEAAKLVFDSGIPIVMVGLDVTRQVLLTRSRKDELIASKTPLAKLLSSMMESHMQFLGRDFTYLSDPITVSLLLDRTIVDVEQMNIKIEYDSERKKAYTVGVPSKTGNVQVSLAVDEEKFFKLLQERVFN